MLALLLCCLRFTKTTSQYLKVLTNSCKEKKRIAYCFLNVDGNIKELLAIKRNVKIKICHCHGESSYNSEDEFEFFFASSQIKSKVSKQMTLPGFWLPPRP